MPQLLDNGLFSVIDTASAIGVGWLLNIYTVGTSTRTNSYPTEADAIAATNANANPLVLPADGRIPAAWTNGVVKLVLTDALGVVKETIPTTPMAPIGPTGPEGYGAVGDNVTDDTAAFTSAMAAIDAAGGGTLQLVSGKTYKTSGQINVLAGIRLDMHEAKIRAVLASGSDAAVQIYSNSIVENGHIEVDSSGSPGTQAGVHAPIRVGNITGSGGTVATPAAGENPSGWIVRNMILESDKYVSDGAGGFVGAAGIQVYGGASNGIIESITVPDNTAMIYAVAMDWSYLGTLASTATFANMTTNRTNFDAGTAYTTHPNNIVVRNVKVGTLSAASTGVDLGSTAVRLSGCYNITTENATVDSVTYMGFRHTAGDLGFEFAQATVKPFACRNIVFRNCVLKASATTAQLAYSDSYADNVDTATNTAVFTADIAGTTLTVSAVASGALAVGHTVYNGKSVVGVISALGTGTGGTGTYTLTGAVTTSSTSMNSGYGWLIDPLHETNIVWENIVGKGPGAGATYGMRMIQQRGGVVRGCDASYFKNGLQVDEKVFGLTIERFHAHYNREDGISVHHGTLKPEDVVLRDVHCHDNGQDTSGYAISAGLYIGGSKRCRVEGGRFGRANAYDPTQQIGIRVVAGAVDTIIRDPHLRSARLADGYGIIVLASNSWNLFGLLQNPMYDTFLLAKYGGLLAIPVLRRPTESGRSLATYSVAASATSLTGLSLLEGDRIEYETVAPGEPSGAIAVADGAWETAGVVQPHAPIRNTSAYTPTNVTPDRAYDADTVLVAELADVVGTLIADLKAAGVLS